jgi:hypothetical protein
MVALILFLLHLVAASFKSPSRLEPENASLRQQLDVLQRKVLGRAQLSNSDRLFFVWLYRLFPSVLKTITIVRPETVVRWHRAGFSRLAWLPPKLVGEVKFTERTNEGEMRHPAFRGLRTDKKAVDVIREQA